MKSIIYRYNPILAERVKNAKAEFVHEFPSSATMEEIMSALPGISVEVKKKGFLGWEVAVDGTVRSIISAMMKAGMGEQIYPIYNARLIQQDDINAYDFYAQQVAEAAQKANDEVVLVKEKIAHHNTEGCENSDEVRDEPWRVKEVLDRWVARLRKCGIEPRIVETGDQIGDPSGKVIIIDHHNGRIVDEIQKHTGCIWFSAYPPFGTEDI